MRNGLHVGCVRGTMLGRGLCRRPGRPRSRSRGRRRDGAYGGCRPIGMDGRGRIHHLLGASGEREAQNDRRGDNKQDRYEYQPQTAAGGCALVTAFPRLVARLRGRVSEFDPRAARGCSVCRGDRRDHDAWEVPARERRVAIQGSVRGRRVAILGSVRGRRVAILGSVRGRHRMLELAEQGCEVERGVRIAAFVGALEGRLCTSDIAPLGEDRAKIARRRGMALLVGEPIGPPRAVDIAALVEQHPEIEGTVGISTLLGTAIGGLCAGDIALILEQHSKVDGCGRMTPRVGIPICAFCRGQIAAFFHQNAEVELADRIGPLIHCPVSTPCHSPQALRFAER
jgi:hypothetical protein